MARYLVVDDSATSRRHLVALLRAATPPGAEAPVLAEADGLDAALEAFERAAPDAVFLDLMLDLQTTGAPGGANGVLALSLMRQAQPGLRVALVTGLPEDHPDVAEAVRLGAMLVLRKPVALEQVRAAVAAMARAPARAPPG